MATTTVRPSPRRLLRWLRNALVAAVVLIFLLFIAGAIYQWIEQSADARRFPQEGRSVALGPQFSDVSLNINCTGQGSPTVVLESGLGISAVGWSLVQPEIAKFTRVCSYDRAGYGWSDAGSMPRTSSEIAKELHALLDAAGEKGPFILVAHSLGGFNVRVYNGEYPSDVTGMVLVDASHEDQMNRMPPSMQALENRQNKLLHMYRLAAPLLVRFGMIRALESFGPRPAWMPEDVFEKSRYLQAQRKFLDAFVSEAESMPDSVNEVRAAGNLGDKPLIVLTAARSLDTDHPPNGVSQKEVADLLNVWINDLQVQESRLSTRGRQIVLPDDHMIPFERPEAIVSAVREVRAAANSSSSRTP